MQQTGQAINEEINIETRLDVSVSCGSEYLNINVESQRDITIVVEFLERMYKKHSKDLPSNPLKV